MRIPDNGGASTHQGSVKAPTPAVGPSASAAARPAPSTASVAARVAARTAAATPQLHAAAVHTDVSAAHAHDAKQDLKSLESTPPQRRASLRGEISQARTASAHADAVAKQALSNEMVLARATLSPAHFDAYQADLSSAHPALMSHAATAQPTQAQSTAPAIETKLKAAEKAEKSYQEAAASLSRNSSGYAKILQPMRADMEAKWNDVKTAVQADLAQAKAPPGLPFTYDVVTSRAQQLKGIDPGNARFQSMVESATTQVKGDQEAKVGAGVVKNIYQSDGAAAAATALNNIAQSGPPDQAARLIKASQPTIDRIAADLAKQTDKGKLADAVTDLSKAAARGGNEPTRSIAQSLAKAFDEQGVVTTYAVGPRGGAYPVKEFLLDDALRDAVADGAGPQLAIATADALRSAGKVDAATKVQRALADAVPDIRKQHDKAQENYAKAAMELQRDLAQFGPAMTSQERAAYVKAFWADDKAPTDEKHKGELSHADVRAEATASADRLAMTLEVAAPALERAAAQGDKRAAKALLEGHESLARSPAHAKQALEWAARVGNNTTLFERIDSATDGKLEQRLAEGVLADGTAAMASKIVSDAAAGADASKLEKAYENFKTVLDRIGDAKHLVSLRKDIKAFNEHFDDIHKGIQALKSGGLTKTARQAHIAGVEKAGKGLLEGWGEKSKFGKSLAIAGLTVGFIDAGKDFKDGKVLEGIIGTVGVAKDATEIGIGVLKVLADAKKVAPGIAEGAAKLGGKYLPLIGFGLDLVQAKGDIDQLRSNPNAGEVLAIVGTGLSLVSDAAEVVPILGTAVGAVIGTVGELVHAIGGFIDGLIEGDQAADALHARQQSYLQASGLSEVVAKTVMGNKEPIALLDNFDIDNKTLRSLIVDIRAADSDHQAAASYFMHVAAGLGLKADQAVAFIRQGLSLPDANKLQDLGPTMNDHPYASTQQIVDLMNPHTSVADRAAIAAELRESQLKWLKSQAPDVYDSLFLGHNAPLGEVNVGFFTDFYKLTHGEDITGK